MIQIPVHEMAGKMHAPELRYQILLQEGHLKISDLTSSKC